MANEEEEVRRFPRLKPSGCMTESSFSVVLMRATLKRPESSTKSQLSHCNHDVGVCLTTLTCRDLCLDVCTRQAVLLDHRGDKAGVLPLSTLVCHREHQTNRTRPCVLRYRPTRSQDRPLPPDVLVIPTRPVPRINDLTSDELKSLMESVKIVGNMVEKAYSGDGLTIACQVRQCLFGCLNPGLQFVHCRTAQLQVKLSPMSISTFYPAVSGATDSSPTRTPYTPQ